jgi:hypothetical protein
VANLRVATAAQQAMCDSLVDRIDLNTPPGLLRIYSGTQPTDANTAIGAQTLLVTLTFSNPAFGSANASGVATASAITSGTAVATGTASFARIVTGTTFATVFDCDVSTVAAGTGTIQLNTTSIVTSGTVSISSFTVTQPPG